MRKDMNAFELIKEANNVSIEVTTKLLTERGLLSLGNKRKRNHFLCIYHQDTNPDLGIWKKGNSVKCFVCHAHAKGAMLYADALVASKFENINVGLLLNSDIEKLKSSTSQKDKDTLSLIKEIKREQHLSIWEGAIHICYADNRITDKEFKKYLKELDKAKEKDKIPFLYYPKTAKDGMNHFGSYHHESNGTESSYQLNNFTDVANDLLTNYDFEAIASREELAIVYSKYIESIIEVRKKPLKPFDYKHLKNVRGMSDEFIKFYGYVSVPSEDEIEDIMNLTLKKLKRLGINKDILKKVPGFIYNEESKSYTAFIPPFDGDHFYIPIEDFYSNKKRFQIKSYGDIRYFWNSTPGVGNCKSPVSVRYPYGKSYKDFKNGGLKPSEFLKSLLKDIGVELDEDTYVIGITEGDFKAVSEANEFNIPILGVQGLGSWPNFLPSTYEFVKTLKSINKEKFIFLIGFDADTKVKPNLAPYGRGLSRVLRNCELTEIELDNGETMTPGIDSYYVTWDLKAGKGFDDVILAGKRDSIRLVPSEEYEEKDKLINEYIALRKGVHPTQLKEVDLKPLYEKLENKSIKELHSMVTTLSLLNSISENLFGCSINDLKPEDSLKMNKYMTLSESELEKILDELKDKPIK